MRRCQTVVLAILLCLVTGFAWAEQGDTAARAKKPRHHTATKQPFEGRYRAAPDSMFWAGPQMHAMAAYLNLSREQVGKIQQIFNRSRSDNRDLRYDLLQKRIEMHRLFTDPKVNAQTLLAKEKELSALRQRLMDARMQALIEVRGVLTPAQIQKLDEMPMMMGGRGMGSGMMGHGPMMGGMGGCTGCSMMMDDGYMGHGLMGPAVPPCMNPPGADMTGPDNPENE